MTTSPEEAPADATLARQAQKGDATAFETLLRRHADRVFSFLLRWLGNSSVAEDVFQEASVRAFRAIERFAPDSRFDAWLMRIAVNEARKGFRTQQRIDRRHRAVQAEAPRSVRARLDSHLQAATVLETGLARLSADHRQVLLLRFGEDLSNKEVAALLGVPEFVVKMRVSRARKRFADIVGELEREGLS